MSSHKPISYAKGVLVTLLSNGIAIPIGIFTGIVTARYLGQEERGIRATLMAIQGLALIKLI